MSAGILNKDITLQQVRDGLRYYEYEYPASVSDGVKAIQQYLKNKGYLPSNEVCDGKFGNNTKETVITYQRNNGLTPDGLVGKATLLSLEGASSGGSSTTLRQGDRGTEVQNLQSRLFALGYDCRVPSEVNRGVGISYAFDGIFGEALFWAVKYFQKRNGLTVDGIAGPNTLSKINSSSAIRGLDGNWSKGNRPVIFYQNSPAIWNNYPYDASGTSQVETIGSSACGVVAMAMALSAFTGRAVLPPVLAKWAIDNGHRDPAGEGGTYASFFTSLAPLYGRSASNVAATPPSLADAETTLNNSGLVIASVNAKSGLTTGGHFVLIYKTDSTYVYINDPNSNNSDSITKMTKTKWKTASPNHITKRFTHIS